MENKNGEFRYTYSASEQEEVRQIREKYTLKEENKMERLRKLDQGVVSKAMAWAISVGVVGVLVLGFGMSLFMSELGEVLSLSHTLSLLIGILVGCVGGILSSIAYPLYHLVLKRERKRIAPEILRLTDELMK